MSTKEIIFNIIKEIVDNMKAESLSSFKKSYMINDKCAHFKVLDVTDYEMNHLFYSVEMEITNSDNDNALAEYEFKYFPKDNSLEVVTTRKLNIDEVVAEIENK